MHAHLPKLGRIAKGVNMRTAKCRVWNYPTVRESPALPYIDLILPKFQVYVAMTTTTPSTMKIGPSTIAGLDSLDWTHT